jgi:hypothetical protein
MRIAHQSFGVNGRPAVPTRRIGDSEIEANAALVAAQVLAHPASLLLAGSTISALASIAGRDQPSISGPERRLLIEVLALVDAVEIAASQEVRL